MHRIMPAIIIKIIKKTFDKYKCLWYNMTATVFTEHGVSSERLHLPCSEIAADYKKRGENHDTG